MIEEGPSVCERCGGELRRVLYPTGIIFKGSGFYRTDSRDASSASTPAKGSRQGIDAQHGREAEAVERRGDEGVERLSELSRGQADWACRVPQRRQNRAFAERDSPHSPQF